MTWSFVFYRVKSGVLETIKFNVNHNKLLEE